MALLSRSLGVIDMHNKPVGRGPRLALRQAD
ncbi:hypothetical protein X566_10385 [Afipia sp. P52-10]|nr:hypothetical protein X566_10385 [Afipia sp. P52-10]